MCIGNDLKIMRIQKKKKNRPKILSHYFGEKIYNCDFSVLRIISQQKVLVGALVMT